MENMDAQLKLWSKKIDHLVAVTELAGIPASFDALMYVDELKALHASARSKFDELRTGGDGEQVRLKAELKIAWADLEAAFKTPMP